MKSRILFIAIALMDFCHTYAYDIAVENEDGVTIYYNYTNNGTELEVVISYSYVGTVNIPEEVTYKNRTRKVTSIGSGAFSNRSALTSVTIGNNVKSIGKYAFHGSTGLTSVTIGNSVTSIGEQAFYGCTGLTSITIPNSVTSIGGLAFYGCSGLTSVTIGNSVKSIGEYAFCECYNLTSVTIGNSVTSIGNDAFFECHNLKKVIFKDIAAWCNIAFLNLSSNPLYYAHHLYSDENTEITDLVIPNSVTSIRDHAFSGCSGLTSVTIPNSVTSIEQGAFYKCSGLTSLVIPNSVTSIGPEAFYGCRDLTSVISLIENPFAIGKSSFDNDTYYNATLYVPTGTIEKYKSTDYWSKFIFIEESDPNSVAQVSAQAVLIQANNGLISISGTNDGQNVAVYEIDGKQVASTTATNGTATIFTNLSYGTVAIVKIGEKAVKIVMQ